MENEQVFAQVEESTRNAIKENSEELKKHREDLEKQTVSGYVQAWCEEKEKKPFAGKEI